MFGVKSSFQQVLEFLSSACSSAERYLGSLKTPQILECSGIGDPAILGLHGINSLVDLPGVGSNLREYGCTTALTTIIYQRKFMIRGS
jgi:choline dehydrogenase-like flavoprotein